MSRGRLLAIALGAGISWAAGFKPGDINDDQAVDIVDATVLDRKSVV